jgi:hypothetical protein
MQGQITPPKEDLFGDIYVYDKEVETKIESLISSSECKWLLKKAKQKGDAISLLDEVLPDSGITPIPKIISKLRPFYNRAEYQTKEDYLQYLKQVYGFLQTPMEVPPGPILSTFYPNLKRTWSPSKDIAQELLVRFYVEVKLISELTPRQWKKVVDSQNPEMKINELIFKTRFKPEFRDFLRKIPWVMSLDAYGAPGLDLIWRYAPGSELPKKPFGVGNGYLTKLVRSSRENRAHIVVWVDDEKKKLTHSNQIRAQIKSEGAAKLDSFLGISKVERDFVIHKHIIIWGNPGLRRYKKASLYKRVIYLKPHPYLCIIREEALPLEIPFIAHRPKNP